MKKICLFLLLACVYASSYATSTSEIASVMVTDLNQSDGNNYEIFAFANTQGNGAATSTSFKFITKGDYTTGDVVAFSLYRNTTNTFAGATFVGSVSATAAGIQSISYPALTMPDTTTLYYMIYATVAPSATPGHKISVAEISNTADSPFVFTGEPPIYIASKADGFRQMHMEDQGQLKFDPKNLFNNFTLGAGIGYTTIYGDLHKSNHRAALIIDFDRQIANGIVMGLTLQHGSFSSATDANSWTTGLSETNQFTALNINGALSFSAFMNNPRNLVTKILSRLYVGTGVGIIDNDITSITRKFKNSDIKTIDPDIKTSSMAAVVPVNMGINIALKKLLDFREAKLNINYSLAYAFNDYVDGYSFSKSNTKNNYNDAYSILSVGISFCLGDVSDR